MVRRKVCMRLFKMFSLVAQNGSNLPLQLHLATCTDAPLTLNYSCTHPKLFHLCEAAHPVVSSCHAPFPIPMEILAIPPRPSSNVISTVKALLISLLDGVLPPLSFNSAFFVPPLLGHFSSSAAICSLFWCPCDSLLPSHIRF